MNADELQELDDRIAQLRAEREKFNLEAAEAKQKAKELSKAIRELERGAPTPKARRGITMKVEPTNITKS